MQKVSERQRRQIRQLIREEFRRQQLLRERVQLVENKMMVFETKARRKGLDQFQINEGLMQILNEFSLSNLGNVGSDLIKRYIGGMVLNFLGINETKDPMLYKFLQNVLEAIDYTEVGKYFGTNQCEELMGVVTEAIKRFNIDTDKLNPLYA